MAAALAAAAVTAIAVALFGRGESPAADLAVRANTVVRIDPTDNAIDDVIDVGRQPNDVAVGGSSVWTYNAGDETVSEIDPRSDELRRTTRLNTSASDLSLENGPLLAADADGAWVVGFDVVRGRYLLTRVYSGDRGKREYFLDMNLISVAAADGAVWVLGQRRGSGLVLRIDPRNGRVVGKRPVPDWMFGSEGQGLAVGGGFVWLTNASSGMVYRLNFRTGEAGHAKFGSLVTRPAFGFGRLWLCSWDGRRAGMVRVDPMTLKDEFAREALPAEEGHFAVGYGSLWRHDVPSGTLMRFRPQNGDPAGLVPVLRKGGPLAVTSIATGAGRVWLSVSFA